MRIRIIAAVAASVLAVVLVSPLPGAQRSEARASAVRYADAGPPAAAGASEPFLTQRFLCDARTPISSLPFTITSCGSYYVTRCLTGTAGENGITISADDVSLDLNGYTLTGGAGSLDGVHVQGGDRRNTVIRNGTLRGWGGDGVDAGAGTSFTNEIRVEDVQAHDNDGRGVAAGSEATVLRCSANGNAGGGISVGGGCEVLDSICRDNSGHGITCENDGWIAGNHVDDNCSGSGIRTSSGDTLIEDNLLGDCSVGIEVTTAGNLIVRNRVSDTCSGGARYAVAGGNLFVSSSDPSTASPWANFEF